METEAATLGKSGCAAKWPPRGEIDGGFAIVLARCRSARKLCRRLPSPLPWGLCATFTP